MMIRFSSSRQANNAGSSTAAATVVRLFWVLFVYCWRCCALSNGEGPPDAPFSHHPGRLRGSATRRKSSVIRSDSKVKVGSTSNASEIIVDGDGGVPGVPEQIHLALADGRPREAYAMSVSWLTWTDSKTQVFWGREADALLESATGNSTRESFSWYETEAAEILIRVLSKFCVWCAVFTS